MGDVYKAQHKVMYRAVALKVIKPERVSSAAAVRRFQYEVQAAARLHHANIVSAYDAEQAGDLHFLVMEFVDGVNLDEVIRRRGQLSVVEACDYIAQTAAGLQYAHELGMVHRDIKPHNLMLAKTGEVKVLDFGLANFATESPAESPEVEEDSDTKVARRTAADASRVRLTQIGTMMGTPDYIAPEQAVDARTADIRSDIYSLGCTFYTLLTGRAPFSDGTPLEKVQAHAKQQAPPLSQFRRDIPVDVAVIIDKMMAKDPADRFQTPAEVAAVLEPVLRRLHPTAHQPQPKPQPNVDAVRRGRNPRVLAAGVALLCAAVLAAFVIYLQTDYGTIRVEVLDDSLEVKVVGGKTIAVDGKDGGKPIAIRAGEHKLVVRRGDSDFELVTDVFNLHRNDKVVLKVELLPGQVVVSKDGKRFGAKPLRLDKSLVVSMTAGKELLFADALAAVPWLLRTLQKISDSRTVGQLTQPGPAGRDAAGIQDARRSHQDDVAGRRRRRRRL